MKYICLLLIASCGEPLFPVNYKCETTLAPFWFEYEPRCELAQHNLDLAQSIAIKHGIMDKETFEWVVKGTNFYVYDMDVLERVRGGTYIAGRYDGFSIHMIRNGKPLMHELLHSLNGKRLQPGTSWHENWDKNGYTTADYEFINSSRDLWFGSPANH